MEMMTRNEYFARIQETGRVPSADILPLDLSAYPLHEVTKKIADSNFTSEETDRNGNYMLSGHWLSNLSYQFAQKCAFDLVQVDGYSSYAFSDEQMAVFVYCEGDITLTLFTDRAKYEEEKQSVEHFYKEEYL